MATVCVLEARINAAYHVISRHIMLINVGQCWSMLVNVDQCWSMLVNVVYIRCVRIYLVSVVEMCEAGNFIASFKFA